MMNKVFHIILLYFVMFQALKAQQVPLYSQYMMNGFLLNPAVAGSEGYTAINITAREQWLGFKDAPKTHAISAQTRILKNSFISRGSNIRKHQKMGSRSGKVGVGAYIFNDKNGPIDRTGIQLTYAYHIRRKKSQLSFGLSAVGYQFSINDKISFVTEDHFWQNTKKTIFIPDANAGVYFSNPTMYCGFSVSQLFQSALRFGEKENAEYKMIRNYCLTGGYDFIVNDIVTIEPSVLIKTSENVSWQADFNTKVIFNEEYWGGLSYRTGGALIFMGGVKVDKYFFGYAFDYPLSSIRNHSIGSHEFMLAIKFGDNARRYRWLNRY